MDIDESESDDDSSDVDEPQIKKVEHVHLIAVHNLLWF